MKYSNAWENSPLACRSLARSSNRMASETRRESSALALFSGTVTGSKIGSSTAKAMELGLMMRGSDSSSRLRLLATLWIELVLIRIRGLRLGRWKRRGEGTLQALIALAFACLWPSLVSCNVCLKIRTWVAHNVRSWVAHNGTGHRSDGHRSKYPLL